MIHRKEPFHVRVQQVSFLAAVGSLWRGARWLGLTVLAVSVLLWMELL